MKCSAVKWFGCWCVVFSVGMVAALASASDRLKVDEEVAAGFETVEMFRAIESGDVEVTVIPKDATEATVMFTNKSKKPLAVALPEAFVAIPVAPQVGFGAPGLGGPGLGIGAGAGGGVGSGFQGFGSGFGALGIGGPGIGGRGIGFGGPAGPFGGIMNVEPDTTRRIKVKGVCLEYGKKDPSPRIAYKIKPIETFTDKADVHEVCKMLARGEISQNIAQAAAWHVMDGLSWKELDAINRVEKLTQRREKWFSRQELKTAVGVVKAARDRAKELAASLASREASQQSTQE